MIFIQFSNNDATKFVSLLLFCRREKYYLTNESYTFNLSLICKKKKDCGKVVLFLFILHHWNFYFYKPINHLQKEKIYTEQHVKNVRFSIIASIK